MQYRLPTLNGPKDVDATVARLDAWLAESQTDEIRGCLEAIDDKAEQMAELVGPARPQEGRLNQADAAKDLKHIRAQISEAERALDLLDLIGVA